MSLETHIAGSEDRLIDGLHFASRNSASYITARRATTFSPSSASSWKPSGVRLARFNLADHAGWLDGGTVRLLMTITNTHASSPLVPIAVSPACMFRRVRIIANGSAVLEDIEDYGRVFQLFSELLPPQCRFTNLSETWGSVESSPTLGTPESFDNIVALASRTVCVDLLSSFLSQGKLSPLTMLPITIEIELGDQNDAFSSDVAWEITRPRLVGDVCDLDQALANSYAKHLLDGKSLPMYMHGMYSIKSSIPTGSYFSLPIARGFTRLSTVYVTFWDSTGKWVNRFHHPNATSANATAEDDLEWNLTIGSDRWPSFNCDSSQESMYRLRLATASHMRSDLSTITPYQYRNNKFIIGQSLEKAPGQSSHTGINTRSGSQLTLNFNNLGTATMCHVLLHYEQIANLSAAGVKVLD